MYVKYIFVFFSRSRQNSQVSPSKSAARASRTGLDLAGSPSKNRPTVGRNGSHGRVRTRSTEPASRGPLTTTTIDIPQPGPLISVGTFFFFRFPFSARRLRPLIVCRPYANGTHTSAPNGIIRLFRSARSSPVCLFVWFFALVTSSCTCTFGGAFVLCPPTI